MTEDFYGVFFFYKFYRTSFWHSNDFTVVDSVHFATTVLIQFLEKIKVKFFKKRRFIIFIIIHAETSFRMIIHCLCNVQLTLYTAL